MIDTDASIRDIRIQELINAAVDRELGGQRPAPQFRTPAPADLPVPVPADHPRRVQGLGSWSIPALAASVAVLLTMGVMVAITLHLDHPADRAHPPPRPSHSSSSTRPPADFPEAVGVPEAEDVPGVTVEAISDQDATYYRDVGAYYSPRIIEYSTPSPKAGEPYSFTLKYIMEPKGSPVQVLSWEFRDVETGDCPGPLLVRPGHTYLLRCQAMVRTAGIGSLWVSYRGSRDEGGTLLGIGCSECSAISGPPKKGPSAAAIAGYEKAAAGVPEATEVPGVSVGPASTQDPGYTGLGGPFTELDGIRPVPGRTYRFTVRYLVHSGDDPDALLTLRPEDVSAGSCPRSFRIRPGHTYRIQCQVTFQPGTAGRLALSRLSPTGHQVESTPLIEPGS